MTGCFGVKSKFPFKRSFGYFREHQIVKDAKIPCTGTMLPISQAKLKAKQ